MSPMTLDANRGIIFPDASVQSLSAAQIADKNAISSLIDAYDAALVSKIDRRLVYIAGEHTFSGNDLTVTRAVGSAVWRCIFSTPIGIHDKVYFEATTTIAGVNGTIIGYGDPMNGQGLGSHPGNGGGGLGMQCANGVGYLNYFGNSTPWSDISWLTGHTLGMAFDASRAWWYWRNITLGQAWQAGSANNDPGAVPPIAYDIDWYSGQTYLRAPNVAVAFGTCNAGDAWTVNFAGPFTGTPPNGFRRWNGTPIPGVPS
jgi:hypothetical protein